jgi:hypothetical protein
MKTWTRIVVMGGLMLLGVVPQSFSEGNLQQRGQPMSAPVSIGNPDIQSPDPDEPIPEASLADWWNRNKRVIQEVASCALGGAGLSYGLTVGLTITAGGAILGVAGAGLVVLFCL